MQTAIALIKNDILGYFNYSNYNHIVKRENPLVRVSSGDIDTVENLAFADMVPLDFFEKTEKPLVKSDLPLSSAFGVRNPQWLLFARNSLKELQYS